MDPIIQNKQRPLEPKPEFDQFFRGLMELIERAFKWIEANKEPLLEVAYSFVLDKVGWLPHYTTPFALIKNVDDSDNLSALLQDYYALNWTSGREAFEARLSGLKVDEEAKAVFREALSAHGHCLYRVSPRLLFPEIERIAGDGNLVRKASLKEVREAIGRRHGLSEMGPGGFGPVAAQFGRMAHHLYEEVRTREHVTELERDPVPNRHAALHGLVPYWTLQSSVNAIIMTEFMFRVLPLAKAPPFDMA